MSVLSSKIHLFNPASSSTRKPSRTYIIYFITGNPGLIEYYRTFLTHLFGLLQSSDSTHNRADFQIYGRSLSGFEVDDVGSAKDAELGGPPYDVNQQIELSEAALQGVVRAARTNGCKDVRVILMGHSMGTYIALEIIRRLREKAKGGEGEHVRVVGAVMLFATVMHLAKSPSGLKSSSIIRIPHFAYSASLLVKGLTFFLPTVFLATLIRVIMSFPSDAARVTASFIKSRHGIQQALHLANDEMRVITVDKWDADIWGAAHPTTHLHGRPALRFLFAKSDHWIANETRDELIRARGRDQDGREEWKPKMEVDETEGWPHGFCIKHSVPVAEKVQEYIEDIMERDLTS